MSVELSIFKLILEASIVVQLVMLLLLLSSIASWALIFSLNKNLKQIKSKTAIFETEFWSSDDIGAYYSSLVEQNTRLDGIEAVFESGFREFLRLRKKDILDTSDLLEGCQRSMKVSITREIETYEDSLPTLATIGSVSPYIGLFGTVWGIMNSFQALGNVSQATLAMVAPGISEALIATAMGLFAAIPAVIAYNRFASHIDRLVARYEMFAEEFLAILRRQINN
ncbi:MAG: protein TolQ [Methylococcaceae bacterium TMED69]|nr:protein TolQ [Pseudomonadota bacterium]OUU75266.1 MAG: protein TolQ [Methylococcaceae bacterium TMED69]|tara:strand:- start:4623 stop:5297 length:675 start_codon:yes stop_codon:yes gene_type:complete